MTNPYDRKKQPAEWQQWINDQIAEHDATEGKGHDRHWKNDEKNEDDK